MSETEVATGGNGNGHASVDEPMMRALQAEVRALEDALLARHQWARQNGITFGGARDEYEILGYDHTITYKQYRDEYARGGIAGRIVDAFPNATWRGAIELIEDEDPEKHTEFEQAWVDLDEKHNLRAKLLRVDKLSQLSTYAVLLIGAPGDMADPLPKGKPEQLLYVTPFSGGGGPGGSAESRTMAADADASVFEYDVDPESPRFGLPLSYMLKRVDLANAFPRPVHWSRINHVAENLLEDEVFGMPALERVWNLLIDLRKVTGGGAEAFWLRANQGLHADIDKDMALPDLANTLDKLKEQVEKYKHQLDRWIRTKGVKVNVLGSDVANFESPADAILTQIAGAKAIPKRILTGSEMGELASSQDRENWRDQVYGRQTGHAEPFILRPFVDRLVEYGYLPTPKDGPRKYTVRWSQITTLTETEKTQGATSWAAVNSSNGTPVFTSAEIREKWADKPPLTDEQIEEIKKQREALVPPPLPVPVAPEIPEQENEEKDDERVFPRAAQERKFASTQVQLPASIAKKFQAFAASILDEDLAEDGREDDPHVTVKYGIEEDDPADVRAALADFAGSISLTLGRTAVFEADEHDVLYVAVKSPDLVDLNKRISLSVDVTDTHPKYVPHATVAYLKPGRGKAYAGDDRFDGTKVRVDSVRFSPREDEDAVDLPLGLRAAQVEEDEELIRVLQEGIEAGADDVVLSIIGMRDLDCGTGAGGFKPGNTCAKDGDGSAQPESVGQAIDDYEGRAPDVDWEAQDLQDSSKRVTEASIRKDYANDGDVSVYRAMIDINDLDEKLVEEEDQEVYERERAAYESALEDYDPDDPDAKEPVEPDPPSGYDWSELQSRRGNLPPTKVEVRPANNRRGYAVTLIDGNHRTRFWRDNDYELVPAWVIDYRKRSAK